MFDLRIEYRSKVTLNGLRPVRPVSGVPRCGVIPAVSFNIQVSRAAGDAAAFESDGTTGPATRRVAYPQPGTVYMRWLGYRITYGMLMLRRQAMLVVLLVSRYNVYIVVSR